MSATSSSILTSPPSPVDPEDITTTPTHPNPPTTSKPSKRKRKRTSTTTTTRRKPTPAMALRTASTRLLIGAHVSMSGGLENAITNTLTIGGNALALFLKSQRKWTSPALTPETISRFQQACEAHSYDPARVILPHGSYLVNLAQPDPAKRTQAIECFVDDLQRCEALGIALYNFHPGSSLTYGRDESISRIAAALNEAHARTSSVKTLLENMAGAGTVVGGRFEDLRDVIALVDDPARVGVCLDTCHMFAAGYDVRTQDAYDATMAEFDGVVGRQWLNAWHVNDSKAPLGSRRDVHAGIGRGCIGLQGFRALVNDERNQGLPMVLETPEMGRWADEIKLLEGLVGKREEDIVEVAESLQKDGEEDRKKVQEQVDKRKAREEKGKGRWKGRGKKKVEPETETESGCESCS